MSISDDEESEGYVQITKFLQGIRIGIYVDFLALDPKKFIRKIGAIFERTVHF